MAARASAGSTPPTSIHNPRSSARDRTQARTWSLVCCSRRVSPESVSRHSITQAFSPARATTTPTRSGRPGTPSAREETPGDRTAAPIAGDQICRGQETTPGGVSCEALALGIAGLAGSGSRGCGPASQPAAGALTHRQCWIVGDAHSHTDLVPLAPCRLVAAHRGWRQGRPSLPPPPSCLGFAQYRYFLFCFSSPCHRSVCPCLLRLA